MTFLSKLSANQKTLLIAITVSVLAMALIGYAVAVYGIRSPDSDPATVNPTPTPSPSPSPSPTPVPQATLSKVIVTPSSVTWGQPWTLTTTLSDGLSGINVDFYDQNGALMGSDDTDASGTASISFVAPVGVWTYHANALHP